MPSKIFHRDFRTRLAVFLITEMLFLNLAWNHNYLGEIVVHVEDYYAFKDLPIFQYRALPSLIYCVVTSGCKLTEFGLNKPLHSSYSVFQIIWDFAFLNIAALGIRGLFFKDADHRVVQLNWLYSGLITTWLILFTFILVPNRAFFYPYDFSDFGFLVLLASLVIDKRANSIWIACAVMFIAAFNKETVLIIPVVYLILRIEQSRLIHSLLWAAILAISGLAGKYSAVLFANDMMNQIHSGTLAANQLKENIHQLFNPLFYFAMISAFAFTYVPLCAIRKHFNYIDWILLAMSGLIFAILFYTGISRELRIYAPITTIFLIILARHRAQLGNQLRATFT